MSVNTFYQWPPCKNCESVFPRAVLIQRICNLANLEMNVVNMPLPAGGSDFHAKLENRLRTLPYLEMDGQKFRSSTQIWNYLLINQVDKKGKHRLNRSDSIYSYITQQWCNDSFINSLVYARWMKEENYQRFITNVDFGPEANPELNLILRKFVLKYLSRTTIGEYSLEAYKELITKQFSSLATIIEEQAYFETFAKHPTLTDLYVFMVVQGFLSPDLEESEWIEKTFPALIRWYKNMLVFTHKDRPTSFFSESI